MKSLSKLVAIGIIAVMGLLLCLLWQRPSENVRPVAQETASIPVTEFADRVPAAFQAADAQPVLSADMMGAIHSNLRKWLEAKKRGSEEDDEQAMEALESMLTDQNAAAIARLLSTEELATPFGMAAIRLWTKANPVEASDWMAGRPDVTEDETWAAAQGWAGDIDGLQSYLDHFPDTAWKQQLVQEASSLISPFNPTEAIQLAERMDPGSQRTSLLQSVATNWIASDPNAAVAWINQVNDPSLREELVASAAQSYALTDPAQAAGWLVSSVKTDQILKSAAINIAQTWATQDPAGAADWVSQFPQGETKAAATNVVLTYWQEEDPGAAAAWIKGASASH
jgi:hypothetical protein